MFCGGPGQSKCAPVRVAADYAAGAEDLDTSVAGNSVIPLANSVAFYRNIESTHDRERGKDNGEGKRTLGPHGGCPDGPVTYQYKSNQAHN